MMSRRRMMMLQNSKPDLLKGYRIDNTSSRYAMQIWWLDKNTIEFKHSSAGFTGPNKAAKNFIGSTASASTGWDAALEKSPAMSTLEVGKSYRLTLTVTEIIQNTAIAEVDGEIGLIFGRGGGGTDAYAVRFWINLSELTVGTKLEVIRAYQYSNMATTGACLMVNNPDLLWDIKFKVELVEV